MIMLGFVYAMHLHQRGQGSALRIAGGDMPTIPVTAVLP